MDQSRSDDELVRRTLSGERAAFDELIGRYQKLVYSIAYRIVQNRTETEDLVQTIFLRVYGGLKTFVQGTEFKSWLYSVAVNTSLNARKQIRRQQEVALKAVPAEPSASPDPAAGLMAEEAGADIERVIAMLPEEQRVVLHLRIHEGLSHEQIAKILGCPTATVTSRVFLARKKLEGLLREFGT